MYYFVDGKWGSYDGVGTIYAKTKGEAIKLQYLDFAQMDGLNPNMGFGVEMASCLTNK